MTPVKDWSIPGRVWSILLSWGMAVILMATIFSAWVYANQRQQEADMCKMIEVLIAGPTPVPGPEGDRGRAVIAAMTGYYERRDCPPPR
jgi:hypothetical protein